MAGTKPYRPPTNVTLADIPVRRELVEWIAEQLTDDPAGDRCGVRSRTTRESWDSTSTSANRSSRLEDPPAGLAELRAVLLQEHVGRGVSSP